MKNEWRSVSNFFIWLVDVGRVGEEYVKRRVYESRWRVEGFLADLRWLGIPNSIQLKMCVTWGRWSWGMQLWNVWVERSEQKLRLMWMVVGMYNVWAEIYFTRTSWRAESAVTANTAKLSLGGGLPINGWIDRNTQYARAAHIRKIFKWILWLLASSAMRV